MRQPDHPIKLLLCLATVYIVWGSSFLFTKIAVGQLPVAMFSAMRFTVAGIVLMLIARFYNGDPWPTEQIEWRHVIITGFFMVFASNGLNTWAIRYIPSNQSALLNGTAAFWIAGLGVLGPRGHPLTRGAVIGLSIGFTGACLMLIPNGHIDSAAWLAQAGVLIACFAWSLGTLYFRSIDSKLSPLMFMALQMLAGGMMLLCLALAQGDTLRWHPAPIGWVAMAYLTFVSSCLAYTAYGWLAKNTSPTVLGTYSYVNPAIAAFLGWQFLNEHLSAVQLIGMVITMIGVAALTLPGSPLTTPESIAEPKSQ